MNLYILRLKTWYEQRSLRERIFFIGLTWIILYAIFYFVLFNHYTKKKETLKISIEQIQQKVKEWEVQIAALHSISKTPFYKQWLKQNKALTKIRSTYKLFLNISLEKKWRKVIENLLPRESGIKLEQIKNLPETTYHSTSLPDLNIYQHPIVMVFNSNYFETINYLTSMEKSLPNARWESINYHVTQYPLAKIQMEFAILYEKHNP